MRGVRTSSPRVKNQSYIHMAWEAVITNCEGRVGVNHHTVPTHIRDRKPHCSQISKGPSNRGAKSAKVEKGTHKFAVTLITVA